MPTTYLNLETITTATRQKDVHLNSGVLAWDRRGGGVLALSVDGEILGESAALSAYDGEAFGLPDAYLGAWGPLYLPFASTIQKIELYKVNSSSMTMKAVVYNVGSDGLPGTFLGASVEVTNTTAGVKTFTFSTPLQLSAGWYYFGTHSGTGSATWGFWKELRPPGWFNTAATYASGPPTSFGKNAIANQRLGQKIYYSRIQSGVITLSDEESHYSMYVITGTLTANTALVLPARASQWMIYNNTSGAFTLTVKTANESGTIVPQGNATGVYCDGNDIFPGWMTGGLNPHQMTDTVAMGLTEVGAVVPTTP